MELKNNIRVLVVQKGYKSLYEFAEQNNMSYYIIRRLANDELNSIDIDFLLKFCEVLNCDLNDVFYIEKEVS